MYYNQDLVDQYVRGATDDGIITYEEMEQAGEAAKDDGIISLGFGWPMQNFNNLYLQMGGQFSDGKGNPTINNEEAVATIEQFKSMHEAGYTNKQGEDTVAQFMNGETIFLPEGTWMLSQMEEITDFEWAKHSHHNGMQIILFNQVVLLNLRCLKMKIDQMTESMLL